MSKKPAPTSVFKPAPTIVFMNDMHCGSYYGLWPEDDLPARKSRFPGVRYLNRCLADSLTRLPEKIDILILAGDLIDGTQRKGAGTHLFTTKLGEQTRGAIAVLEPLAKRAKTIYRLDGTPYHEDFHGALQELDVHFGVKKAAQVMDLELPGGILNAAHHPTGGSTLYRGTALDRESLWAEIAAVRNKVHRPRWIVRAHKHNYAIFADGAITMVALPCWELQTPHAAKQAYWRFQPDLGLVAMLPAPDEPGGYRFKPILYDPPKKDIIRVA